MSDISQKLEEWKLSQVSRLPKISLPCLTCKKEVEVNFDPPLKCPHCDSIFLGKKSASTIIMGILLGLAALAVAACGVLAISNTELGAILLKNKILFFLVVLAVIIPFIKFMFFGAASSVSAAVTTGDREKWTRYTNRVSGTCAGYGEPLRNFQRYSEIYCLLASLPNPFLRF